MGWLVGYGPSTISSWDQGAISPVTYHKWNSHPVPRAARAKVKAEAAIIAHQPVSQGIEPGTTESVDGEESPEPPAPLE